MGALGADVAAGAADKAVVVHALEADDATDAAGAEGL